MMTLAVLKQQCMQAPNLTGEKNLEGRFRNENTWRHTRRTPTSLEWFHLGTKY